MFFCKSTFIYSSFCIFCLRCSLVKKSKNQFFMLRSSLQLLNLLVFPFVQVFIKANFFLNFNKFPDFFCTGIYNCRKLEIFQYVVTILLMRWLTNFFLFRCKFIATVGIRVHLTKSWLSQLVNFKNAIWTWGHIRRTICDQVLF